MQKVDFLQFEIFYCDERITQFGGPAADRRKLIRKARAIAQKVINRYINLDPDDYVISRRGHVYITAWRGTAIFKTLPNGRLLLTGSTVDGWDSNPINEEVKDLSDFFAYYCGECVRHTAHYDRAFKLY